MYNLCHNLDIQAYSIEGGASYGTTYMRDQNTSTKLFCMTFAFEKNDNVYSGIAKYLRLDTDTNVMLL